MVFCAYVCVHVYFSYVFSLFLFSFNFCLFVCLCFLKTEIKCVEFGGCGGAEDLKEVVGGESMIRI